MFAALTASLLTSFGVAAAQGTPRPQQQPTTKPAPMQPDDVCAAVARLELDPELPAPWIDPQTAGFTENIVVTLAPRSTTTEVCYSRQDLTASTPTSATPLPLNEERKALRRGPWRRYDTPLEVGPASVIFAVRVRHDAKSSPTRSRVAMSVLRNLDEVPWNDADRGSAFSLRTALSRPKQYTAIAFDPSLSLESRPWSIIVDVPFGFGLPGSADQGRGTDVCEAEERVDGWVGIFGNPSVTARVTLFDRISAGLRLTVPMNNGTFDSCDAASATTALALSSAGSELYRYAGGYIPLGLPLAIEHSWTQLHLHYQMVGNLYLPVLTRAGKYTELTWEHDLEIALRTAHSDARLIGGLRLRGVLASSEFASFAAVRGSPGEGNGSKNQFSAEPFIGVDTGRGWVRLGTLIPLDRPLGFGFDRGRLYTVNFTLGRRL
ncbi:hypothetical protein [Sorangium sp. So ce388]|uniref:hypothetical protein n=1 Tax=Sorangium sp. So ce388 TaxID=3133309 RepID=UPI003F5B8552